MALKDLEVRYATKRAKDYKLADGEGLHLLVRPNGSKLWRMKYRFADRIEDEVLLVQPPHGAPVE